MRRHKRSCISESRKLDSESPPLSAVKLPLNGAWLIMVNLVIGRDGTNNGVDRRGSDGQVQQTDLTGTMVRQRMMLRRMIRPLISG